MNPTPARVHPQEMLIAELLAESLVQDVHGRGYEGPAALADVRLRTAGADDVVVCHVDIEHELALSGVEGAWTHGFFVSRLESNECNIGSGDKDRQ